MNLMKRLLFPLIIGGVLIAGGCDREKAIPRTSISPVDASDAPVAGMAHGNHNPKYGGVVLMNGDLHFEVVAKEEGHYTLYFSDAARRELPASVVTGVHLAVKRPGFRAEGVDLNVDPSGDSWVGTGGSVDDRNTDLRISFTYQGQQIATEIPFFAAQAQKAAMQTQ
jgi:hypothetical protein